MGFVGNDQMLVKIAVFGLTMSLMCTVMIDLFFVDSGDYSYDSVAAYRSELIEFSGESMINESPWVLTSVYTPWTPNDTPVSDHVDEDGWLYGQKVTDYTYLNRSAGIRLETSQKSDVPITYTTERTTYTVVDGYQWWADGILGVVTRPIAEVFGADTNRYADKTANSWNFTGYRYVFDPTLPFKEEVTTSSVDGSLSLVWYSYNGQEGLSGGLDIYGGKILLASYSATDIISAYSSTSSTATTYDFDFGGAHLTLSVLFDQDKVDGGVPLMQAWSDGYWSMAISSKSAGNFFDLENSAAFTTTAGSLVNTFTQIYTFNCPVITNSWMQAIVWLLVGLPMTIAMLCVTLRLIDAVKPL